MAASSWSLSDESWRWNEYIIEEQVGGDQWSKLHKAREVLTNKIIAVKIFGRFCIPAKDRSHVRAIENEVEMLGAAKNGVSKMVEDLQEVISLCQLLSHQLPGSKKSPKMYRVTNDTISLTS